MLQNKHGEFWLEVKNATLFTVAQYEGYKDQHYICFHTSNICMYHQGNHPSTQQTPYSLHSKHCRPVLRILLTNILMTVTFPGLVDTVSPGTEVNLPCRTRPHWLEPGIYQTETIPDRSSTASEGMGLEAHSMLSVAIKISAQNTERTVKVRSGAE